MENLVRHRGPGWTLVFKVVTITALFFGSAWLLSRTAFDILFSNVPIDSEPAVAPVCGRDAESREGDGGATWISFGQHLEPTMVHTANVHGRPLRHLARVADTSAAVAHVDACVLESSAVFEAVHEFGGCGGYFRHDSLKEAVDASKVPVVRRILQQTKITQQKRVEAMLPLVNPQRMAKLITSLSEDFPNRYYRSKAGVDAAKFVEKTWKDALKGLTSFASVRLYTHRNFKQPSVIASLKGKTSPEKIVVIGGHLDSIVGRGPTPRQAETFRAPGADDNASGLTCATEILKIFAEHGHQPDVTVEFMGYAGEEKGLLGSDEIAKQYKREGKDVRGVLQLDMTGYQGAPKSIYFVTSFVDENLTMYLQSLLKAYLPNYSFGRTDHEYASSDHASWHRQGYPASFICESPIGRGNPNYHSTGDTLRGIGGNANGAARFARLGLLFAVEMAFDSILSTATSSTPSPGTTPGPGSTPSPSSTRGPGSTSSPSSTPRPSSTPGPDSTLGPSSTLSPGSTPGSSSTTGPGSTPGSGSTPSTGSPPPTKGNGGTTTAPTAREESNSIQTILLIAGCIVLVLGALFLTFFKRDKKPIEQDLPTKSSARPETLRSQLLSAASQKRRLRREKRGAGARATSSRKTHKKRSHKKE